MPLSVIELIVVGLPSEHVPHIYISYVEVPKVLLYGFFVEMDCIAAIWARSNVHDNLDAIIIQQLDKRLKLVIRMTNCVDHSSCSGARCHPAHSPPVIDGALTPGHWPA